MKRIILPLALVAIIALVWTFVRSKPAIAPAAPKLASQAIPEKPASVQAATIPQKPEAVAASRPKPRVLNDREFNIRFGLTQTDAIKLSHSVYAAYIVLIELRGDKAVISNYDGSHVRVALPPLDVPNERIETLLISRLSESLGEEKAKSILSDPDGFETMMSRVEVDRFQNRVEFVFTKTKDYQTGASADPTKEGSFDAERVETVAQGTSKEIRTSIREFRLSDAYNFGLGWNALSKVPQGYFREETIAGFRDAPRGESVIYDQATDKVEMLDTKYPGSVVPVPRS